jgi:CRISPR-associated protein Csm3
MLQLKNKILLSGKIIVLTGLHIGGTNSSLSIGGIDKSVVRDPITRKPYIPGSSIKGKMRSLFELSEKSFNPNAGMGVVKNGPAGEKQRDSKSARMFGIASNELNIPSRLIVRDARMLTDPAVFKDTPLYCTEAKTEVVIDRITSKAMPRQMERIPAGTKFELSMVLNIFEGNGGIDELSEDELLKSLFQAMILLQDDYLGGSGSRGYGQVQFKIDSAKVRGRDFYHGISDKENDLMDKVPHLLKLS